MSVSVQRLPNEPILIATLAGLITADDVRELYRLSAALIGGEPDTFHRITDTRASTSNFAEMLKTIQTPTQELRGSSVDPHIQVTFVGTDQWVEFLRTAFQSRGVSIGAFPDMETALESVRIRIDAERRNNGVLPEN